ncbi:50S ribosomal protein L25/general stress protein Ctc [Salipaludibacillus neizhouensis]|uniref:Large ribosomal subunit protein bL25 n=1 Tax=Salipaludibacillus neizhouensis TaxID=885475 RepID=A0A3A9K2R7_9BACI|nr:50S ribosomal protein L25/general stress protein Ctc [Salipaludibacillus neizhouensis]RKL65210.1 50S ribosomal protein L25/general stress protein Ctc [Salipaludibacillus neizhouensis]
MTTTLQAAVREDLRNSRLAKIRNQGNIPAIVYGKTYESKAVSVQEIAFIKTLRDQGKTGVFKLELDGEKTDVMIYDMQVDRIKNRVLHVDFYAVDMKVEMDADVPVHVIGESIGVKEGGVLQQAVHELSVRALPKNLPNSIDVEVSELDINDSIQVKDLKSGAKFEFNNEPEEVVVSILAPSEEPEESEEETEEKEPELVGSEDKKETEDK